MHRPQAPPSSWHWKVIPACDRASVAWKLNVAVVELVVPTGAASRNVCGGVVSIVM